MNKNSYYEKYLKYKNKYIQLKKTLENKNIHKTKQLGGNRSITIHSKKPGTTYEPINFDEDDDIYIFKRQIVQQINNPEINEEHIILYDFKYGKCTGIIAKKIEPDVTDICVDIMTPINSASLVPENISTGRGGILKVPVTNLEGEFEFANCKFSGMIESGFIYRTSTVLSADILDLVRGFGVRTFNSGNILTGQFINNQLEGNGKINHADGAVAEGFFVSSVLNGTGKINWPNGELLEGNFVDGVLDGEGVAVSPEGEVRRGNFVKGILSGKGNITKPDGTIYSGEFISNNIVSGKIIYTNGSEDEGFFKNNKLNGRGKKIIKTSPESQETTVMEGEFLNGFLNGLGLITYPNGRIEEGKYINGDLVEPIYKVHTIIPDKSFGYDSFFSNLFGPGPDKSIEKKE